MPLLPVPSVSPIPDDKRAALCDLLAPVLADLLALAYATKAAHWAVRGRGSHALHATLFDPAYEALTEQADAIAEHVRMLGGDPGGSVEQSAEETRLDAYPRGLVGGMAHCKALGERYTAAAAHLLADMAAVDQHGAPTTFDKLVDAQHAVEKWGGFILDETAEDEKPAKPAAPAKK